MSKERNQRRCRERPRRVLKELFKFRSSSRRNVNWYVSNTVGFADVAVFFLTRSYHIAGLVVFPERPIAVAITAAE